MCVLEYTLANSEQLTQSRVVMLKIQKIVLQVPEINIPISSDIVEIYRNGFRSRKSLFWLTLSRFGRIMENLYDLPKMGSPSLEVLVFGDPYYHIAAGTL